MSCTRKEQKKKCTLRAEEDAVNLHYPFATMFVENLDTVKNVNVSLHDLLVEWCIGARVLDAPAAMRC